MRLLIALMALNAAAAMPISFFSVGLPTLMREAGASLEAIGFAALVYLPFALAFLWAPYIERPRPFGFARRKFWIVATLVPMAIVSVFASMISPGSEAYLVILSALVVSIGAATLRTTILGLTVEQFEGPRQTWAAALVPAGGAVGAILGATGLLFVYGLSTWTGTMLVMAAILLVLVVPGLLLPELDQTRPVPGIWRALKDFVGTSDNRRILIFIIPVALGLGLGFGMIQPRLVDLGYAPEEIGVINGVFTAVAMLTGGPLAATCVNRFGLKSMLPLGVAAIVLAMVYSVLVSGLELAPSHAAISVLIFFFAFSFIGMMTNLIFMQRAESGREGTDFSIFICFYWLCSMVGIVLSGLLASSFGYVAAFGAGAVVTAMAWCVLPFRHAQRAILTNTNRT